MLDLDVQVLDLDMQILDLDVQILDLDVRILDLEEILIKNSFSIFLKIIPKSIRMNQHLPQAITLIC